MGYFSISNDVITYCQIGDRIFEIDINHNTKNNMNNILLEMLSTIKFNSAVSFSQDKYSFIDNTIGFSFDYSSKFNINQIARTGESVSISFEEQTFDGLNWKKFSISYEKTHLSLEECLSNDACFIWGELSNYTPKIFAGENVMQQIYLTDNGQGNDTNSLTYILKRGEYIVEIQIVTDVNNDNKIINDIADSFQFL